MTFPIKKINVPDVATQQRKRRERDWSMRTGSAEVIGRRLELLLPVTLAVHGSILLLSHGGEVWLWLMLELLVIAGAASLLLGRKAPRRSRRAIAIRLRAVLVLFCTAVLIANTGGTSSPFVLWLFVIVAVYPLMLSAPLSIGLLAIVSVGYVGMLPFSSSATSVIEIVSRAALMLFTGALLHNLAARFRSYEHVRHLANFDELTRVANRRNFFERGHRILKICQRTEQPLTLVMFDLNQFKQVNDTYGHSFGDACLRAFASHLRSSVREGDIVARLGGDEFVVLMPDSGIRGSSELVRRVSERLTRNPVPAPTGQALEMKACAGIATLTDDVDNIQQLIDQADADLYRAKERSALPPVIIRRKRQLRVA